MSVNHDEGSADTKEKSQYSVNWLSVGPKTSPKHHQLQPLTQPCTASTSKWPGAKGHESAHSSPPDQEELPQTQSKSHSFLDSHLYETFRGSRKGLPLAQTELLTPTSHIHHLSELPKVSHQRPLKNCWCFCEFLLDSVRSAFGLVMDLSQSLVGYLEKRTVW